MLDLAVSGVSSAILKKGMKRGQPAETLVIPSNSWTADPR
jgi:predicted ATP-grasp superfamily ATP-dependent carboligase